MANRDPAVFPDPNTIHIDRRMNRHTSFGLGVHRCIGSNLARTSFKTMIREVLNRMPDYECDASGTEYYESVGVINGVKQLPARFTPRATRGRARRDDRHLAGEHRRDRPRQPDHRLNTVFAVRVPSAARSPAPPKGTPTRSVVRTRTGRAWHHTAPRRSIRRVSSTEVR